MPRRIFPAVCRKPRSTSLACTHTLKMAVALNNLLQRRPSCSDELLMPPDASPVPCVESHARTHAMKMAVALDKCSCQSHARTHACSCSACPRGVMSSSHRVSKATLQHHAAPAERALLVPPPSLVCSFRAKVALDSRQSLSRKPACAWLPASAAPTPGVLAVLAHF